MNRTVAVFAAFLVLTMLTAIVAYADDDDEERRGGRAPEVPAALIYPAIGLAGYGIFRVVKSVRGSQA